MTPKVNREEIHRLWDELADFGADRLRGGRGAFDAMALRPRRRLERHLGRRHPLGLTPASGHQYVVAIYRKFGVRSRPVPMRLWLRLHSDFAQTQREQKSFAPFTETGPLVAAIQRRIRNHAQIATTPDPALHIAYRAGGAVIESRHAVPGLLMPDPRDRRRLGVKIAAITIGGQTIPLDHPALAEGWHDLEPDGRWTNGHAAIPAELLGGVKDVTVRLAATLPYPIAPAIAKKRRAAAGRSRFKARSTPAGSFPES